MLGDGKLGLLVAQVMRLTGCDLLAVGRHTDKLAILERLGIPVRVAGESGEMKADIVVDCTGHGVPGAFMSMIGNTLLNDIIKEQHITDPSKVLEYLHIGIRTALKQERGDSDADDGMDVCLCSIDREAKELSFAGAKRPLYLVRNGTHDGDSSKLIELKGDRKSVGGRQKEEKHSFTNNRIHLQTEAMELKSGPAPGRGSGVYPLPSLFGFTSRRPDTRSSPRRPRQCA